MPPMPQHVFSSKILDHLNDLKISKDIQDPNLEMVQNPPKNNLCKCLPPNFHRQIYDLPIPGWSSPNARPGSRIAAFCPEGLACDGLVKPTATNTGEKCGVHIFQCRDESNVEMRKKAKLPQYRHLQSPTVRGPCARQLETQRASPFSQRTCVNHEWVKHVWLAWASVVSTAVEHDPT